MSEILQLERRTLDAEDYPGLVDRLNTAGLDAPSVAHLVTADGSEIQFPAGMAGDIDGLLSDMPSIKDAALKMARSKALKRIRSFADAFSAEILKAYPVAETLGWPAKQAEAKHILGGGSVDDTLLVKSLAAEKGLTDPETQALAAAIIAKAEQFAQVSAVIETLRNDAESAAEAATDAAMVRADLDQLKAQAISRAIDLGYGEALPA